MDNPKRRYSLHPYEIVRTKSSEIPTNAAIRYVVVREQV